MALDGTLITQYNEFVMPRPGTTITTVETKYSLYDGLQVMCDLDENGDITKRYVYAGGKHVAMDLPGNKDYMTNGGFEYGNYEYPLTPWFKWAPDGQTSAVNWQIVSDVKRSGSYGLKATAFSATYAQSYVQHVSLPAVPFIASCYMKAQDLTGGAYVIVECWTAGYGAHLQNFVSNLQLGTFDYWKFVSIPVTSLPEGTGAIKVNIHRLNGTGTVWIDDVRCEEGVSRKEDKSYFYHCDYLGSPRVMTDATGAVIWRQDYYAFGSDYNTSATGNTHKFTGHVQDAATGQYYAKARYFTTSLGRFSQPEPLLKGVPATEFLANPQLLNPYVYCHNNPLKYGDPDGKEVRVYSLPVIGGHRHMFIGVKNSETGQITTKGLYPKTFMTGAVSGVLNKVGIRTASTPEVRTNYTPELGEVNKLEQGQKANVRNEATIKPPEGMTEQQYDQKVLEGADNYPVKEKGYNALSGPNSNTYVDDTIEGTGGTMPDVKGATGQNYGEEKKKEEGK